MHRQPDHQYGAQAVLYRHSRNGRGKRTELRNGGKRRTSRLGVDGLLTSTQPDRDAQEGKRGYEEGDSVLSDFELEGGARGDVARRAEMGEEKGRESVPG